jgi:hypothetical protein
VKAWDPYQKFENVLRENTPNLERAFEIIGKLPEDMEFPNRDRDLPQKRGGL